MTIFKCLHIAKPFTLAVIKILLIEKIITSTDNNCDPLLSHRVFYHLACIQAIRNAISTWTESFSLSWLSSIIGRFSLANKSDSKFIYKRKTVWDVTNTHISAWWHCHIVNSRNFKRIGY